MAFDDQMLEATLRRDKAIKSLQKSTSAVSPTVKGDAQRLVDKAKYLADNNPIEELIQAHPFIATGVALGAGVLASKLMAGSSSKVSHEPQRVVIELNHSGVQSATAPQPPKSFSIIDFVQKAIAGYETAMATLRNFQASGPSAETGADVGAPDVVQS